MESWIDLFSLSWLIPLVLDSVVMVAGAVYDYFVAGGSGVIYLILWGFLIFSIGLYLAKVYLPAKWLALFGFSGGGQAFEGKGAGGWDISKAVLKPLLRGMLAAAVLLQIRPGTMAEYIVNPFLQFGQIYVSAITRVILPDGAPKSPAKCPADLGDYLTTESCESLVQPVDEISAVNNTAIKHGFGLLFKGFAGFGLGAMNGLMNVIAGLALILAFAASNMFMALLIVQGIFKFGLQLIIYPFKVLLYVIKDDKAEWFNPWPALSGIVGALKVLVISMIAVAFVLLVNMSVAGAIFGLDDGEFAGGAVTLVSAFLSFWILQKTFELTRKKIDEYVGDPDMTGFYDKVRDSAVNYAKGAVSIGKKIYGATKKK